MAERWGAMQACVHWPQGSPLRLVCPPLLGPRHPPLMITFHIVFLFLPTFPPEFSRIEKTSGINRPQPVFDANDSRIT